MTARLQLENDDLVISLGGVHLADVGMEAQPGVTGLGLPPVAVQWLEGAGDGATYRGRRVQARTIDIPIYVNGRDRDGLKQYLDDLARMLSGVCTLRMVDDETGESWYVKVVRVGGGDYVYGVDTLGDNDLATVVTLMAGDPFWTFEQLQVNTASSHVVSFLANITKLELSYRVQLSTIELVNTGNATAYPKWVVTGPGSNFYASDRQGHSFRWAGVLAKGDTLTIDTKTGVVIDNHGNNRYAEMDPGPQLWHIPPGTTFCDATLEDTDIDSKIDCHFSPRSWLVI